MSSDIGVREEQEEPQINFLREVESYWVGPTMRNFQ